jgi:hypothetical protein
VKNNSLEPSKLSKLVLVGFVQKNRFHRETENENLNAQEQKEYKGPMASNEQKVPPSTHQQPLNNPWLHNFGLLAAFKREFGTG